MSRKIPHGQLLHDVELKHLTTWNLGGKAEKLYRPKNLQDLQDFLKTVPADEPLTWLGLGSNVLIRDGGLEGTVILTQGALGQLEMQGDTVRAEAGVASAQLARFAAKHNLCGGEFLAGVPGTIGGALVMNAGAFGAETWNFVTAVETIDRFGEIRVRQPSDFTPQYRQVDGLPENEWFVAGHFEFEFGDGIEAMAKIKELLSHRSETQPTGEATCGSVFRNPPGNFSAKLIESCGLKNFKLGKMQVSEKHANFLVNRGGATAKEAETLIKSIQDAVYKKHGVQLRPEVKFIGKEADTSPFGKVAVLMGGQSAEREVSLNSGNGVFNALRSRGINAFKVDVGDDIVEQLQNGRFDRAFNVLHGPVGEDGTINGLLDCLKIPCTGSGVLGAAIAMDKVRSKQIWQAAGLPTPDFMVLDDDLLPEIVADNLGFPLAIKPIYQGSSVGVSKVYDINEIIPAFEEARQYGEVMAEQWVEGKELTVGIVGEYTLPSIHIDTSREFYDYDAKYIPGNTEYHCPSGLDDAKESELRSLAFNAYKALGCKGWGRVDFMQDTEGFFYLIDTNTTPGMTATSLLPKAAKQLGWSYDELVIQILEQTLATNRKADSSEEALAL